MSDLKDSGERQKFESGAVRDMAGNKPAMSLVPGWAVYAYGWILEAGARKYSARNWENGMPISRYIDSAQRHLEAYKMGFRDEPHLWQAFWNIGAAIHTQVLVYIGVYPKEFYDLPNHVGSSPAPIVGEFEKERIDKMMVSSKDLNPIRPTQEQQEKIKTCNVCGMSEKDAIHDSPEKCKSRYGRKCPTPNAHHNFTPKG